MVRVFAIVWALGMAALCSGCAGGEGEADRQAEWREVLQHKKAAAEPGAPPERRQVWADSVRGFAEKHPEHTRAKEVWMRIQIEFADDLMAIGRTHQAIRFYRSVLQHDPRNERALSGWRAAAGKLVISREKLAAITPRMRQREVAAALGHPMPGWTQRLERRGSVFEAWYYRTARGVAAVHFREGRVIAAEETSSSKLGRLGV